MCKGERPIGAAKGKQTNIMPNLSTGTDTVLPKGLTCPPNLNAQGSGIDAW